MSEAQTHIWISYQRMRTRLAERISRELAQNTGLSDADAEILIAVLESPQDSIRAMVLRCGLEWEKSRLSHQLKRMETRGLLVREDCFEDNRGSIVRLTEIGRELALKAKLHYEISVQRYFMDVLSEDQLAALQEITATVLRGLEKP